MNPLFLAPTGTIWDVIQVVVMVLFVVAGILLIFVVLIQEGKGGGIAGAFGGAGAEAFGVKAGTVNRFTAYVGTAFILLALVHAGISSRVSMGTTGSTQRRDRSADEPPGIGPVTVPGSDKPPTPPADGTKPPEPAPAPAPAPDPAPAPLPGPGEPPAMGR